MNIPTVSEKPTNKDLEKAFRRFLGEVYKNIPESKHVDAAKEAEEVFQLCLEVSGYFGFEHEPFAVKEVIRRLNGQNEDPEMPDFSQKIESSVRSVSDAVEKAVEIKEERSDTPERDKTTIPFVKNKGADKECPLPSVKLTTDMRMLAKNHYSEEDLKGEDNPFNGTGAICDLKRFNGQEQTHKEWYITQLRAKLEAMVKEGASEEHVMAVVSEAIGKGASMNEVSSILGEIYRGGE